MCSSSFIVDSELIVSVGHDEILIKEAIIDELSINDIFESLQLLSVDVHHFELTLNQTVGHVVQHLIFQRLCLFYDTVLNAFDGFVIGRGVYFALLE